MLFMGIDVGTTGCKTVTFDDNGNQLASAYQSYALDFPKKGWMQLDAEKVFLHVCECIRGCNQKTGGHVAALAVSCQGEAMIPVSKDGRTLYPAIVTFDVRSVPQFERFCALFDRAEITRLTGSPVHPMFSLTKLLWIKDAEPKIYNETWKFLSFGDYIVWRLGVHPIMDYSMATRTLAFDLLHRDWSKRILASVGLDRSKLPDVAQAGTKLGKLAQTISQTLGFSSSPEVVLGAHDQSCCALGTGVLASGEVMCSLGTTQSLLCVYDKPILSPKILKNNIPCGLYAIADRYAYLSFLSCCGSVLRWYTDHLLGGMDSYATWDQKAAALSDVPTSLMILPYFSGSGTPYLDFNAKGAILGLTLDTEKVEIYKAILECLCMETRLNIELMSDSGIQVESLRVIGGGSHSDFWLQMQSDIIQKPVCALSVSEAGCLGAAMLAGLSVGAFKDASSAVARFCHVNRRYLPNEARGKAYGEKYLTYRSLYNTLRKIP